MATFHWRPRRFSAGSIGSTGKQSHKTTVAGDELPLVRDWNWFWHIWRSQTKFEHQLLVRTRQKANGHSGKLPIN